MRRMDEHKKQETHISVMTNSNSTPNTNQLHKRQEYTSKLLGSSTADPGQMAASNVTLSAAKMEQLREYKRLKKQEYRSRLPEGKKKEIRAKDAKYKARKRAEDILKAERAKEMERGSKFVVESTYCSKSNLEKNPPY